MNTPAAAERMSVLLVDDQPDGLLLERGRLRHPIEGGGDQRAEARVGVGSRGQLDQVPEVLRHQLDHDWCQLLCVRLGATEDPQDPLAVLGPGPAAEVDDDVGVVLQRAGEVLVFQNLDAERVEVFQPMGHITTAAFVAEVGNGPEQRPQRSRRAGAGEDGHRVGQPGEVGADRRDVVRGPP